jgi:sporulation protein YlmC with PRC-barrel domain
MQKRDVWFGTALVNDRVRNAAGEDLGKIEDIVIDPDTGTIRYAILSFGGIAGMGDKLFAVPWSSLSGSPSRDYVLLNIDKSRLERAPGFDRDHWPDFADPTWQRNIDDYYGGSTPVVRERTTVYVERRPERRGMPVLGGILVICLLFGMVWVAYLVSTRGWDQTREDIRSTVQSAAYAAKETSQDAALTAKVKAALALSKRIPAGAINVDSDGDVVTLRGEVPSDQIRQVAEAIARDVPGVREVHNHIYAVSSQ